MKKLFLFIITALFTLDLGSSFAQEAIPLSITAADGTKHDFMVEMANTPEKQALGLMFRKEIPADSGMLFDFGEEKDVRMWMKNTYIPLDMLFINAAKEIIFIVENTTPLSLKIISAPQKSRYVLEIKGGTSKRLDLKEKDKITFSE